MGYMDINLTGVVFTDYPVVDVGSGTWQCEHDWFTRQDLVIRTASGGGGTLLVEGTDYTLSQESTELSTRVSEAVGSGRNVFHLIAVINVAYQTGNLYISGKYIADSNSAEDVEYRKIMWVNNADYTVRDDDGYGTIAVNPSSADRTVTLPTVADNTYRQLTIINTGSGSYRVIVDGEGVEYINDVVTWWLFAGQSITIKSFGSRWGKIAGHNPVMYIEDQKAAGTSGGTSTSGAWYPRDLNTVVLNEIAGAGLASNRITLPPGVYWIKAHSPLYSANYFKIKVRNYTDSSDPIIGTSEFNNSSYVQQTRAFVEGPLVLTAQKEIEIDYRCSTGVATQGLGVAGSLGVVEVYAQVKITKLV